MELTQTIFFCLNSILLVKSCKSMLKVCNSIISWLLDLQRYCPKPPDGRQEGKAGAYPRCHRVRGKVHSGQVASLSQGSQKGKDSHSHSNSHLQSILQIIESPINQTKACFWTVRGSCSNQRKPRQSHEELSESNLVSENSIQRNHILF